MIDLGLGKLLIIGVVALVVVGPEKLPALARTAGRWVTRMQRFIATVKSDVARQMELEELRQMQNTLRASASSIQNTVRESMQAAEHSLAEIESQAHVRLAEGQDLQEGINLAQVPPASSDTQTGDEHLYPGAWGHARSGSLASKRRNKRATQVVPLWYLRQNRRRGRALSGAARVARYRYQPKASSS